MYVQKNFTQPIPKHIYIYVCVFFTCVYLITCRFYQEIMNSFHNYTIFFTLTPTQ